MDNERAEELLMQISAGDRDAFAALFEEAAPGVAARLAYEGVPTGGAEAALVQSFADLWQGDYAVPLKPGQTLPDWLAALALEHAATRKPGQPQTAAPITPALWRRVERQAFPESWRNILRRTDVVFGVIAAIVWALILRLLVN